MGYNPFSLEGKTVLVTGASSGIGRATAVECSRLGASVVLTGRNEARLAESLFELDTSQDQHHKAVAADLTSPDDLAMLCDVIDGLDGVAHCAGIAFTQMLKFAKADDVDKVMNTNFVSPLLLLSLLFKKRKLNNGASVAVVASVAGKQTFSVGNALYGASKAAVASLVKYSAVEFASRKIRVNSVSPGMTETPLIHAGAISDEQIQAFVSHFPLKRIGQPRDIALAIVYLLSEASSWMTGHDMVVDGGESL